MKIQDFINKRNKYKIDYTYQRPNKVWSNQDNQCLIDTILRGEPLPLFFLNQKMENGNIVFYIVDGQQRLNCIREFYENKIKLSAKFSGVAYEGKTFNGDNAIKEEDQDKFLNYDLNFFIMEDYDDERVRLIFSRLQRGKPLNLGERLNALPGDIVVTMRKLANHPFIKDTIDIKDNRYEKYPDVARMLFYEVYGAKNCSPDDLYKFFDDYKNIDENSKVYKNVVENLNYLQKCFKQGKYTFLRKHAWIIAIYSMISDLRKTYAMTNKEEEIRNFVTLFVANVYDEDMRKSNIMYNRYYDNVRGGWSEKNQMMRKNYLINEFVKKYNITELDNQRQITDEEKMVIFSKHPYCDRCKKHFDNYNDVEYHHIIRYADGGTTELNNMQILCTNCHDIIHGKKVEDVKITDEDDEVEEYE